MNDSSFPPSVAPEQIPAQKKHSGVGIASLLISILFIVTLCLSFTLSMNSYKFSTAIQPAISKVTLILFFGSFLIGIVGIGLGIAGTVQKKRKRVFGIIGLSMNILILLGICLFLTVFIGWIAIFSGA